MIITLTTVTTVVSMCLLVISESLPFIPTLQAGGIAQAIVSAWTTDSTDVSKAEHSEPELPVSYSVSQT